MNFKNHISKFVFINRINVYKIQLLRLISLLMINQLVLFRAAPFN